MNVQCPNCTWVWLGVKPEQVPSQVACQMCGTQCVATVGMLRDDISDTRRLIAKTWKRSAIVAIALGLLVALVMSLALQSQGGGDMPPGAPVLFFLLVSGFGFVGLALFLSALKYYADRVTDQAVGYALSLLLWPIMGPWGLTVLRRYVAQGEQRLRELGKGTV